MAFRSSNSAISASGVDNVTVNAPAGLASGDIILINVNLQGIGGATFNSWPTGFATIGPGAPNGISCTGASNGRAENWLTGWKLAGGSEPGSYTVNISTFGTGKIKCTIGCWSGRASSPGTAIGTNSTGNGASGQAITIPTTGYSPATGDDVAIFVGVASANTAGSWSVSNTAGFTDQLDLNDVGTFNGGCDNISSKDNISSIGANLSFAANGTGLVGGTTFDSAAIVIPLPSSGGVAQIIMGQACL
jgi:hypothetical protein